ncbi:MAG: zf-HC2 domain-containing protein [Clostridia bacterium]
MNKCDKYENLISLYLDDMLLNSEIEDLLEHLDSCDRCHDYYADLKRTRDSLKNLKIEYPEDLSQSILDKIQQNKDVQIVQYTPPKRKAFYALLATCACLAIVISTTSFDLGFGNKKDTATSLSTTTTTMSIERSSSTPTSNSQSQEASIETFSEPMAIADAETETLTDVEEVVPSYGTAEVFDIQSSISEAVDSLQSSSFSNSELLLDDYAFVFEFEGIENIDDISGKILFYEDNLIYLEVENTISLIENVIITLENYNYEMMTVDLNDYRISSEATSGIFIIHTS